jgi:sporulation protein YlmC with PRC-barrel domain
MLLFSVKPAIIASMIALALPAYAQAPGKIDLEAAELAMELIGGPVYASDGGVVGTVTDLALDESGRPLAMRMETARQLGFGTRIVQIPHEWFMILRGAVVLDIPADAMEFVPEATDEDENAGRQD